MGGIWGVYCQNRPYRHAPPNPPYPTTPPFPSPPRRTTRHLIVFRAHKYPHHPPKPPSRPHHAHANPIPIHHPIKPLDNILRPPYNFTIPHQDFLSYRSNHMSQKSLQTIAGEWHGGQNTALYAYASTGTIPQYRQHARKP